jgi:sortase B
MKRFLLIFIATICAIVFAVCAYYLITYFMDINKSEKSFDDIRKPVVTDEQGNEEEDSYKERQEWLLKLKADNDDLVGWLYIKGTKVDYPVMQTKDEQDFYIHRDFDKEYSSAGTLFASELSDFDKPSEVITIYGHMMKAGTMFGGLKKYTEKKYWEKHKIIRLDTLQEERNYEIMSVFKTAVATGLDSEFKYYNYADFEDEEDYNKFIAQAVGRQFYSTGVPASYGDEFIMLSTCEYSQKNGRLVVLARRIH